MKRLCLAETKEFAAKPLFNEKSFLPKDFSWPQISIVTPSLNHAKFLEATILSVLTQNYPNLEYIIIDGGSTDVSVEIIKKYEKYLAYWVSEPDKGIYEAMNKGISRAHGEWLNFMNAGDVFYTSDSLSLLKKYFRGDTALIYGDVRISYTDFERTQYAKAFSHLWRGMICCHQSVFIKKQIMARLMFNLEYNLAADYDLLCRLYLGGYRTTKVDMIISKVINGGQSDVRRIEVLREFLRISARVFKSKAILIYITYSSLFFVEKIKKYIKRYLPKHLVDFLIKSKYHFKGKLIK